MKRYPAIITIAASVLAIMYVARASAGDIPQTPPKTTIPGTGGYLWKSDPPPAPNNMKPNMGGSIGVQYPPDRPTTIKCSRDGKPVAC